jgi:predicted transcriptional regulator
MNNIKDTHVSVLKAGVFDDRKENEISWSSLGAVSIDDAKKFVELLQKKIEEAENNNL